MMKMTYVENLGERYYSCDLPNGLHIHVVPKPGFQRKYAFYAVDYGAIDTAFSLEGRALRSPDGVAHYLEHKMFDLPDGNADARFAALGSSPNAFTSFDITAYYFSCTDHFEENFRILSEMVFTPYFTEESVEKERGIIGQEIRMYEDNPDTRLYENLFAAMFPEHPVSVPIAGSVESIAEITSETLYDCFRAFYTPANMVLCVVGDVDPERIAELAEELLPKECCPVPRRTYGEDAPLSRESVETRQQMEVAMPIFALGFRCARPLHGNEGIRTELIGDLACELLAGESTQLYQDLYEANLIDTSFSTGYECVKEAALISFSGDSRDPAQVRDAILESCARQLREGLDAAAFERLKKSSMGRKIRELDSFEGVCSHVCSDYFDGGDYYAFPQLFASITLEDIRSFLEETVCPERMVLSVIEPKEKV